MLIDNSKVKNFKLIEFLKENALMVFTIGFLVTIVYLNSINNEFVSDDIFGIVNNKIIGTWEYLKQGTRTYPSRLITHTISYQLGGRNPVFFRLPIIITHFLNTTLVFVILSIFKKKNFGFLAAILFAVHPLLTEPVIWISAGSYVYTTLFFLLSFLYYIIETKTNRILSILFFLVALSFSAFSACLPFILLLYEFSNNKLRRNWKKTIPYFTILFIAGFSFIAMLKFRVSSLSADHNQAANFRNPLIHIPSIISTYLELFLWPQNLTLYHSDVGFSMFGYSTIFFNSTAFVMKTVVFLMFVVGMILSYFKDKFIFFWLGFFAIAIAITLVPLSIVWTVAERYVYLASIGLFVVFVQILWKLFKNNRENLYILIFVFAIILGVRTIVRNSNWKTADDLWLSSAEISPTSPQNHNNLGDLYRRKGDLARAKYEFETAIQLKPTYADAMHNLAATYLLTGDSENAKILFEKSIEFKPTLWQSHLHLANIYIAENDIENAEAYILKSVQLNQQNPEALATYAVIESKKGNEEKANQLIQAALRLDPNNPFVLRIINRANQNQPK
ncbi:tetratricopeptide repeat protein [Patescibacteria group bacterium]